jgi:release factor glutamine methyltransferase
VYATDVSRAALNTAGENARQLEARISFLEHDILNTALPVDNLDVIVSNPPYIALQEKATMSRNVVDHEPHLALFVDNADPLLFYRNIAVKGSAALKTGGLLFVEINERYGSEVAALFKASGYSNVAVIKDISGKDRIVKGWR